jgi:hypothetical protein
VVVIVCDLKKLKNEAVMNRVGSQHKKKPEVTILFDRQVRKFKKKCYFHGQDNMQRMQQDPLKLWYFLPTRLHDVNSRRQKLYHMPSIPGDNSLYGY